MNILGTNTKVMTFRGKIHKKCKIMINNQITEKINNFNYLEFILSYCQKEDVNIKVNKVYRLCGKIRTLKNKTLKTTQLKCYKIIAVPLLNYTSKNWTLQRSEKKIEISEMKFLCSVAGVTLLDKNRRRY